MATNCSPAPLFETDDERASFVVRLPVHPLAKQPTTDVTTDVTVNVAALLQVIQGEMPRPAMTAGYLEMILPDTPRSTRQRYRLTPLGLQELKGNS